MGRLSNLAHNAPSQVAAAQDLQIDLRRCLASILHKGKLSICSDPRLLVHLPMVRRPLCFPQAGLASFGMASVIVGVRACCRCAFLATQFRLAPCRTTVVQVRTRRCCICAGRVWASRVQRVRAMATTPFLDVFRCNCHQVLNRVFCGFVGHNPKRNRYHARRRRPNGFLFKRRLLCESMQSRILHHIASTTFARRLQHSAAYRNASHPEDTPHDRVANSSDSTKLG